MALPLQHCIHPCILQPENKTNGEKSFFFDGFLSLIKFVYRNTMNRKLLAVLFVLCAVQVSLGRSRGGKHSTIVHFNIDEYKQHVNVWNIFLLHEDWWHLSRTYCYIYHKTYCSLTGDRLKCNGAKKLTCCNNIKKENFIEGLLGVVAKLIDIKADGTASCSPVSVAVIGGAAGAQSCSGQSLCCDDTNTVGFLAVGCSQAVGTFG